MVLANRDRIREIAASCNADRIALFGSVARGDDTADSDCDFIADLKPQSTLLHLARMKTSLEDLLGCTVDVVSRRSIPPGAASVEEEAIPLWAELTTTGSAMSFGSAAGSPTTSNENHHSRLHKRLTVLSPTPATTSFCSFLDPAVSQTEKL